MVTLLIRLIFAVRTYDLIYIMRTGAARPGDRPGQLLHLPAGVRDLEHRPGGRDVGDPAADRAGAHRAFTATCARWWEQGDR